MFGKIYETTWWGNPIKNGWGGIYFDLAQTDPKMENYIVYYQRVVQEILMYCVEAVLQE